MRTTVVIDVLQCQDCKRVVVSLLENAAGISNINVDVETKTVSFDYTTHNAMEGLRIRLAEAHFPISEDPSIIKRPEENLFDELEDQVYANQK